MKTLIFIFTFFLSGTCLFSQDIPSPDVLESLGGYVDLGHEVVDLNGDGISDVINLVVHNEDGDFSNFVLMINEQDIKGKHSYNVDKFIVIDLDKSDKQKEVAVHTPNPNGPDEYIIYKYDGTQITEIGRTHSTTTFNGDGTLDVVTYMPFWDRLDVYVYDRQTDEITWQPKEYYTLDIDCKVLEEMPVFLTINSRGFSEKLKKGQTIKIIKAIHKPDCNETGAYAWGMCDEFQYVTESGSEGWATMKQMMGNIDLPLIP